MVLPISARPVFIGLTGDQGDPGPRRRSHFVQDSARILVAPRLLEEYVEGLVGQVSDGIIEGLLSDGPEEVCQLLRVG